MKNKVKEIMVLGAATVLIVAAVIITPTNSIKQEEEIAETSPTEVIYVIGNHIFTDETDYLTTKMIMLASRTIEVPEGTSNEETLKSMTIYLRDLEGNWIDATTGTPIDVSNIEFDIEYKDLKEYIDPEYANTEKVSDYNSLQEAIDNAIDGKAIVIDKDIQENATIPSDKDITLLGTKKTTLDGYITVQGTLRLKKLNMKSTISGNIIEVKEKGKLYVDNSTFTLTKNLSTAIKVIPTYYQAVDAYAEIKNSTFNANGQRPIQSGGDLYVENCKFIDQYRYSIQLTAKNKIITFKNNVITQSVTTGKPTYGLQLTYSYGNSNLIINVENNVIEDIGEDDALYVWETSHGGVDIDTITLNGGEFVEIP